MSEEKTTNIINPDVLKRISHDILLILAGIAVSAVVVLAFLRGQIDPGKSQHYIRNGNIQAVKDLFSQGKLTNDQYFIIQDKAKQLSLKPVQLSAYYEQPEMIKLFLEQGDVVNSQDKDGHTALYYVVYNSHMPSFQQLTQHNVDPNIADNKGESPLFAAIRHHDVPMVKALLGINAKVDVANTSKQTPLHIAAEIADAEIMTLLLQHQAPIDRTNNVNEKPGDILKRGIKTLTQVFVAMNPKKTRDDGDSTEGESGSHNIQHQKTASAHRTRMPTILS